MPPKRGKKGKRRGDDSSDDDADIDALDPLAHLRGGKQGNSKKGGPVAGDGEEGEEEKKKPLTKKEKRRIEEEQRRQRDLEAAAQAGGEESEEDDNNNDNGNDGEGDDAGADHGADPEPAADEEATSVDGSKSSSTKQSKKDKKAKKGKKGKSVDDDSEDEEGDGAGEEDRPKKPMTKKERRRLDEEERRQRELAEIEAEAAAAAAAASAAAKEARDIAEDDAGAVVLKKGGKKDKKKKGKKGRRGDDSDDDNNDDEDVEGSLSRGVELLSVNDDKPVPPASGDNKAASKMSKKERRKAEATAMAAAAVADGREDGQDSGDGERGQEELEAKAAAAEMAAADKKKATDAVEAARVERERLEAEAAAEAEAEAEAQAEAARKAAKKAKKEKEKAKMEEQGSGDDDDGQKRRMSKKERKKAKQQGGSKKKGAAEEFQVKEEEEEEEEECPQAAEEPAAEEEATSSKPPSSADAAKKSASSPPSNPAPQPPPSAEEPTDMDVDGADDGSSASQARGIPAAVAVVAAAAAAAAVPAAAPAWASPPAADSAAASEKSATEQPATEGKKPKEKKSKLMRKLEEAARLKAEAEAAAGVMVGDNDNGVSKEEQERQAAAEQEERKRKAEKAARKAKKEAAKEKESKVKSILEDLDDAEYYGSDHEEREHAKGVAGTVKEETVDEELARLVAAAEAGGKAATARQRKKILQDIEARRRAAAEEMREELAHREGAQFGCSQTAVTAGDQQWNNSLDITIDAFSISAHDKTLFKDSSLQVVHGRKYGLVGPNGAGKSTLLKMIASGELKIPPRIDCLYVEQEVVADDTPAVIAVMKADKARWSLMEEERRINRLLREDPDNDKLNDRLQQVHEELHTSGGDGAEAQARRILFGLGFDDVMQVKATKHFSGGWRMRISLARALFMEPTLLMLDEPTNHLDLNAVIWLDDYLQKWKKTLLVVSHDQDFLNSVCEEILHLDHQKINQYKGNYDQFKEMEAQKRKQQAKEWEKQQRKLAALKKGGQSKGKAEDTVKKSKFREPGGSKKKKNDAVAAGTGEVETVQLIERPREYVVTLHFPEVSILSPPVLEVMDVQFQYPTGPVILKDVNFGLDQTSRICIVGPNGAGKTTLLKLLTGALEPTEGFIRRNPRMRAGIYNQHFVDRLPMDIDPTSYLRSKFSDQCDYQTARNLLGRFGLEGHAHTIKMRDLSGGQKARVVFCELSLQAPHVLFLDEPTNNLDIESIDALCTAVTEFNGGVVVVTHDARLIEATECRLWIVDEQEVTPWQGAFEEYREDLLQKMEEKIAAQELARAEKEKASA